MSQLSTIATTFLIISDTHNFDFDDSALGSQPFRLPTPKADVLLHCGDFAHCGGVSSFKKALRLLGSIEAELKLVIAGNHDLELDKNYWEAQRDINGNPEDPEDHDHAFEAMTGPLATAAGITYLNEGTHMFSLRSGATFSIYVSPYTPAFYDWAFAYEHPEDRFNIAGETILGATSIASNPIPQDVDIVMTHGPPHGVRDFCPQGNVGCPNLLQALKRVKPLMHCFGHIHQGNGVKFIDWANPVEDVVHFQEVSAIENPYPERLSWKHTREDQKTLAVNAAIMTEKNEPESAPWLITLELRNSW